MGRELRKVPANWEHPKKNDGSYQPMFDRYYLDELNLWLADHNKWQDGTHMDLQNDPSLKEKYPFWAMYGGDPPDVSYYHTRKYSDDELTHIQLYETTSEGTPKSPVFHTSQFDELCKYAAEHCTTFATYKATKEQWKQMLSDGLVFHQQGNAIFL